MNLKKLKLALIGLFFFKDKNGKNRANKNFLIASAVLAIVFIALAFTTTIAWLFIVLWVLWLVFAWLTYSGKLSLMLGFWLIISLVVLFVISLVLVFTTHGGSNSKNSAGSTTKALTSEQCKPYYDLYNNKVLNISSDGLQGTIGIKIDMTSGCKLHSYYNVLLSQNLPQNPYSRDIGPSYHYTVMLRSQNQQERTQYDGYGSLSPAYKNFTSMPDPFSGGATRSQLYSQGSTATETRYFYWGYEVDTNFSEARYQEILDSTKLEIVDGTPFIEEKQEDTGWSYTINDDRAAVEGTIVKTYTLTIE
jgi:hypothetical protein